MPAGYSGMMGKDGLAVRIGDQLKGFPYALFAIVSRRSFCTVKYSVSTSAIFEVVKESLSRVKVL